MTTLSTTSSMSTKLLKSFYALPPPLRQAIFLRQTQPAPSTPISRQYLVQPLRYYASTSAPRPDQQQNEPLIPAPSERSGPLLSRAPNRALPAISPGLSESTRTWLKTLPLFLALCALGSFAIFNYQKSSSSTVSSILYALRTSPAVRELLGDEIYFNSKIPWISGDLNQLHGHIDISFWVKGKKGKGLVRFVSVRRRRDGYFETLEWSLKTEDGTMVHLLDLEGRDPVGQPPMVAAQKDGAEL